MPLRAVIFDVGGVLFNAARWEAARDRWAPLLGLTADRLAEQVWYGPDIEAANVGAITAEEYCRRCAERLGSDPAQVQMMIEEVFAGEGVNERLVEYARGLRGRVLLGVLTKDWAFGRELMARQGIGDLFVVVV